ncbi:MAG: DUF547 domain-containing protein [Magnetococcales bacterium]|nr:DUF547 domain-containing protein [Magnetococcales bacterium]
MTKALAAWFALCGLLLSTAALAAEPDWSDYAGLLQRHLKPKMIKGITLNALDYRAMAHDPALPGTMEALSHFSLANLTTREEKLAFFINAYNLLAIKIVLDHRPLESIKDAGYLLTPVWKMEAGSVGGQMVTLHHIEHEVLRPMGEPRIHMAIVCASLSCPNLSPEPYTAARLDDQLSRQTREFLNDPVKGLRINGHQVRLSRIFSWFEEDFAPLPDFLRRYRPDLPQNASFKADLPYDWSLNGE